jgi:hypothetical protein
VQMGSGTATNGTAAAARKIKRSIGVMAHKGRDIFSGLDDKTT